MAEDIIDNHAKELLKKMQGGSSDTDDATAKGGQDEKKFADDEKKLDNDKNNSYILEKSGSDASSDGDPDGDHDESIQRLLEETFGGDPKKLAKSYLHSQKEYQKVRSSLKETEKIINTLNERALQDALFKEILEVAARGESVENYLKNLQKPNTGKSVESLADSKLDTDDLTNVTETTLAKAGLLDVSKKSEYTAQEWDKEVLKAQLRYTTEVLPKTITEKTLSQIRAEQEKLRATQEEQELMKINLSRLDSGFEAAVKSGYDFTGEHKDLYDAAIQQAKFIRDPNNPKLIHQNAFTIALELVSRERGIEPKKIKPLPKSAGQQTTNYNGRNVLSGGEPPKPKLSKLEAIREKMIQKNVSNPYVRL